MDVYVATLSNLCVGYTIVQGRGAGRQSTAGGVIYIDVDSVHSLTETDELELCVRKRFSGKRFKSLKHISLACVIGVLSSHGYEISHESLKLASRDFMLYVWEFIHTLGVSSSTRLSTLVKKLRGSRSKQGFETRFPLPPGTLVTLPVSSRMSREDTGCEWTSVDNLPRYSFTSYGELRLADAMLEVIRTVPCETFDSVDLWRYVLERAKEKTPGC